MHLSTESGSHLSQGLNKSYTVSPPQFVTISIFIVLILKLLVLTSNSSPYLFSLLCVLPENNVSYFSEILTFYIGRNFLFPVTSIL